MLYQIIAIYKYIIYIDYASYIDQLLQHLININLKNCKYVCQFK